jgi:hypothetical protein
VGDIAIVPIRRLAGRTGLLASPQSCGPRHQQRALEINGQRQRTCASTNADFA